MPGAHRDTTIPRILAVGNANPETEVQQVDHVVRSEFKRRKYALLLRDAPLYNCERIAKEIRRLNPVLIGGVASRILDVAEIQRKTPYPLCPRLRAIVYTADTIASGDEETLQQIFGRGVRVTNRYGANELGGEVAQECPDSREVLHWNPEQYYVEVTDEAGQPVSEGKAGHLLITDLHNFVMPLIRYSPGDLAVARSSNCRHGWPTIGRIAGRSGAVLVTPDGKRITEETVVIWLRQSGCWGELREYQMVLRGKDQVTLRGVLRSPRNKQQLEALRGRLVLLLRKLIGGTADITVEFCDQIERSPSGKRPVIVHEPHSVTDSDGVHRQR